MQDTATNLPFLSLEVPAVEHKFSPSQSPQLLLLSAGNPEQRADLGETPDEEPSEGPMVRGMFRVQCVFQRFIRSGCSVVVQQPE